MKADGAYFRELYRQPDPWGYRTRWYEQRKRALLLAMLDRPRYRCALELACSIGETTVALATRCDELIATDADEIAVGRARRRTATLPHVRVLRMQHPGQWPRGQFDLVVFAEIGYYMERADLDRTAAHIRGCLSDDAMVLALPLAASHRRLRPIRRRGPRLPAAHIAAAAHRAPSRGRHAAGCLDRGWPFGRHHRGHRVIAVIIPAHDEAALLPGCLRTVRQASIDPRLRGEPVQVYVALDDCSDTTGEIAAAYGALGLPCRGRDVGHARAHAAAHALAGGARWLASTDADSRVPPDWLSAQLAHGADAVCGTVRVFDWENRVSRVRALYEQHYHAGEGHRHVHGANLGVSAPSYRRAGGFRAQRSHEDVSLVRRLQQWQARIAWSEHPCVVTSARRSARCAEGFSAYLDDLARVAADATGAACEHARSRAAAGNLETVSGYTVRTAC